MPESKYIAPHCRIGKIKFKSGAELHVLPSLRERNTADVFADLDKVIGHVRRMYAVDLGGYVMVPWTHDGDFTSFVTYRTDHPTRNTLPEFMAEVMRRDNGDRDADRLIKHRLGL